MKNKLNEGMRAGDLDDLILPLISVDEYESKINKSVVTIGFYVHDEDAAKDLNRFLQKSPVEILSSEVSPAPDQHGFFLVFIELMDNKRLPENLTSIFSEIEPLCNISQWKMRVRKNSGLIPFTEDNLTKAMQIARNRDKSKIKEFLSHSLISNVLIEGEKLFFHSFQGDKCYEIVDFGINNRVMSRSGLENAPLKTDIKDIVCCNRVTKFLGEGWSTVKIGANYIIQKEDSNICLVIKET